MNDTDFGQGLIEGLQEALDWKKSKLVLEFVDIEPIPAAVLKDPDDKHRP